MNFQTMNKQRKLMILASLAGIISIFLPWFSAGAFGFSVHVNGFHGWGILAFLCFVAVLVISLVGNQTQPLDKSIWFAAMICGALCLLSIIITIFSAQTANFGFASASLGFGIWISLIAAAGIIAFAWMFKNPADDLKGGFESLKKTVSSSASAFSNTNAANHSGENKIAELERLSKLKDNGSITEEEFQRLKSKLI